MKKKEKKEFKSFGELAEYIWDYYKWGIIAGVFVLICVISFVREKKNAGENVLSVFVVNPTALQSSEVFARGLDEGLGVDGKKEYIDFSAMSTENEYGYVNQQTLVVRLAANTVDATVMEYSRFYMYAVNGGYADLRTYFTEEQLATLEGALWYMDGSALARALSPENTDDIEEEEGLISKDATDFADPVPVGIDPECSEIFSEVFVYTDEPGCAGICTATQRPEMAVRFMQYIFPSLA